jgi:hypothetical protein
MGRQNDKPGFARLQAHRQIDDTTHWRSRSGSLHIARSFQ